jgi:hypothetical protein
LNAFAIAFSPWNNPHHDARIEDCSFRVWHELLVEKSVTCKTFQPLVIIDVLVGDMSLMIYICARRRRGECDMRMDALIGFCIGNNGSLEGLNLKRRRFVVGLPSCQNTVGLLKEC